MAIEFNILNYLAGLTGYVFDKDVLVRVAWERDVTDVTSYDELDQKIIDLLRADLLYTAYTSPSNWASSTNSHGSFTSSTGSQMVSKADKERLYDMFMAIYKKYGDERYNEIEESQGNLQWL